MTFGWADHACRICGSRLAVSEPAGAAPLYECGNCGVRCSGKPDGICGCGVHLGPKPRTKKDKRAVATPTGPRFFCTANAARSASSPAAIVIMYGDKPL